MLRLISHVMVSGHPKTYPVGGYISRQHATEKIKSGKFIQAVWRKNNGQIVSRNVRHGVTTTLKGGKYTCDPNEYIPVTDMGKYNAGQKCESWINIKVSTLIGIVIRGSMYLVK